MADPHRTGTPPELSAQRAASITRPVTDARLQAMLSEAGVPWFVDHEGDLGIQWRRGVIRLDLWRSAHSAAVLLLSASWHRRPAIERLGSLLAVAQEWNAAADGLKTYARVLDDGDVLLCFEGALLVQSGVSDQQLVSFLHTTMAGVFDRVAQLEARYPDPLSFPEVDQ